MMTDTTIINDPYIFVLDNVISKSKCNNIIKKFNKSKTYQGVTSAGIDLNVKNSQDLHLNDTELDWSEEDALFKDIISDGHIKYYQHLNSGHNFTLFTNPNKKHEFHPYIIGNAKIIDTGYQIQKTEPGKGYVWHDDFTTELATGAVRYLTFILYLNTVDEGWTQFYNGDQVSPKAGRLCFFPATWTYLHQGYPPKQTKYLMTGWMHNLEDKETKSKRKF